MNLKTILYVSCLAMFTSIASEPLHGQSASDYVLSTTGGKVGIGTSTPERQLHIEGDAAAGIDIGLKISNSGVGGKQISILAGNTGSTGDNIRFWDGTRNVMTFDSEMVGIGTTSPRLPWM